MTGIVIFAILFAAALVIAGIELPEDPPRKFHLYARRGSEVAEFLFKPEAEAREIEADLRADGWAVRRVPAPRT